MKIKIADIKKLLQDTLIKKGLSRREAKIIAVEYLEGELQGKLSHGLAAFPSIVKKISAEWKPVKILKKTHSLVYVDANFNFGAAVGKDLADRTIKMASKEGVGLALIKDMTTWLRPGTIARYIAEKNYLAIVVNNGGKPMTAPPGGFEPMIGTNPIGIGIPTASGPIVADLATSMRAWGELRIAKAKGKKLLPNSFYDKLGNITLDPDKACSALPFGGYKGFALAFLIEILTGSLVNMPMGKSKLKKDYRTLPRGGFILTINPKVISNLTKFKKANNQLANDIKKSKKIKGVKVIMLPGERANKIRKKNLKFGYLEIKKELWKKLNNIDI